MAPYEESKQEADGDPNTVLENTSAHERIGFRMDDTKNASVNLGSTSDWLGKENEQRKKSPR
ncbi:hypothetical protein [Paenibacillus sp.]|uniref:hypothetical protein n=1 Tax=Paenibacillus sp. TaxID=58172 RepID=UPI0028126DF9|nr:hypothetical protein [Paenibacillus sp.]